MPDMSNWMVGRSNVMQAVRELVDKVAPTDATVLISGESGSGKELVAQAIHARSARGAGPFLGINCGALPPSLIESELFGFERGSFTGAVRSHAGMVERASGGTLFLDEVTEMSADMQTRLLRFLETQRFFRVGGSREIQTDVRVVAAKWSVAREPGAARCHETYARAHWRQARRAQRLPRALQLAGTGAGHSAGTHQREGDREWQCSGQAVPVAAIHEAAIVRLILQRLRQAMD